MLINMRRMVVPLMLMLANRCRSDNVIIEGGGLPDVPPHPPVHYRSSFCPSSDGLICTGHGICGSAYHPGILTYDELYEDYIGCQCYAGFTGPDCSLRYCPAGVAWADMPMYNETAHKLGAECSNFGFCDRGTGVCACRDGYTGEACQRFVCPGAGGGQVCSGHGACLTSAEAPTLALNLANRADPFDGTVRVDAPGVAYHQGQYGWPDGDNIVGCVCEEGWEG
jgi:hypothetical protein